MNEAKTETDLKPAASEQPVDILGIETSEYVPEPVANDQKSKSVQRMRIQASMHRGPLPSPEMLAEYDRVLPGLAERIVNRFEKQSDHRMALESTVVTSDAFSQQIGTVAGSLLGILSIGGGIFLSYLGKDAAGVGVIITAVAGLVGVFGIGKWSHDRQLEQQIPKDKLLDSTDDQ